MKKNLFIFFISMLLCSKSFAEKYNVRNLSVEDILADKEIEFIL